MTRYEGCVKLLVAIITLKALMAGILGAYIINGIVALLIVACILLAFLKTSPLEEGSQFLAALFFLVIIKLMFQIVVNRSIPLEYVMLSMLPKLIVLLMGVIILNAPYNGREEVEGILKRISYCAFAFCVFELVISDEMMAAIMSNITNAKLVLNDDLTAYKDYFLGLERKRLGSIFFEPITFGMVSSIILCNEIFGKKEKKSYLYLFALAINIILSGAKSAMLFLVIVYYFNKMSYWRAILATLMTISIILYAASPMSAIEAVELTYGVESITNHILGLIFGILNSLDSPVYGHGIGTAGYLVYLASKQGGNYDPFRNEYKIFSPLENGNESGVGVLFYENGFILCSVLVAAVFYYARIWHKKGNRLGSGMLASYFSFALLSESSLSASILVVLIYFLVKYKTSFYENNI